jgi:hypothetical protein
MEVGAERAGRGAWLGDGAADPALRRSHPTILRGKVGPPRRFTAMTAAPSLPATMPPRGSGLPGWRRVAAHRFVHGD